MPETDRQDTAQHRHAEHRARMPGRRGGQRSRFRCHRGAAVDGSAGQRRRSQPEADAVAGQEHRRHPGRDGRSEHQGRDRRRDQLDHQAGSHQPYRRQCPGPGRPAGRDTRQQRPAGQCHQHETAAQRGQAEAVHQIQRQREQDPEQRGHHEEGREIAPAPGITQLREVQQSRMLHLGAMSLPEHEQQQQQHAHDQHQGNHRTRRLRRPGQAQQREFPPRPPPAVPLPLHQREDHQRETGGAEQPAVHIEREVRPGATYPRFGNREHDPDQYHQADQRLEQEDPRPGER